MWKSIVLCFSYIFVVNTISVSDIITKCKWDDTKCLTESMAKAMPAFSKGLPEFGVRPMDPLEIKSVNGTTSNIKLVVSNMTVTNLKNCEAQWLKRDLANQQITLKLLCRNINCEANYDINGQLSVVPIRGNGDLHVKIGTIILNIEVNHEDFNDKEGVKHWKVKTWNFSYDLEGKSDVKFDNLFPDSEFLRNTTNELIAKNGNDVITEIGTPIIKAIVYKIIRNIERFFANIPIADLVIN